VLLGVLLGLQQTIANVHKERVAVMQQGRQPSQGTLNLQYKAVGQAKAGYTLPRMESSKAPNNDRKCCSSIQPREAS
jgi:hypothetical protein